MQIILLVFLVLFIVIIGLASYFAIENILFCVFGIDIRNEITVKYIRRSGISSFDPSRFKITDSFRKEIENCGLKLVEIEEPHWVGNVFGETKTLKKKILIETK
jgi:hypothetical protein